jgi:hypothetical protein
VFTVTPPTLLAWRRRLARASPSTGSAEDKCLGGLTHEYQIAA